MNFYLEKDFSVFFFLSLSDIDHYTRDPHESILDRGLSDCKSRLSILLKRKHGARADIPYVYRSRSFICDKNVLENLIFKTRPTSAKIKLSAMLPATCLDLHAEKSNAPPSSSCSISLPLRHYRFEIHFSP